MKNLKRPAAILIAVAVLAGTAAAAFALRDAESNGSAGGDGAAADSSDGARARGVKVRDALRDACKLDPTWVHYIRRGWDPSRGTNADLILVPKPRNYVGTFTYTPHSGPYDYLQRVPMVWYGPGFIRSAGPIRPDREVTVTDIGPTQAELLEFEDWPSERPSSVIEEVLEPSRGTPRLIVTISIDGGGMNALEQWPDRWPNLKRLMEDGASVEGAVVGSSPSITPAVHTSLSTGTWPRFHGVTAIGVRQADGKIVGGFAEEPDTGAVSISDPTVNLRTTTLPDLWDLANDNEPLVGMVASGNYALGMVGNGAALEGADKDLVAMHAREGWATSERFYSIPDYISDFRGPSEWIDAVDRADGKADGLWRGHEIPLDSSPAFAPYQNATSFELLEGEGFGQDDVSDLFYIQYKAPDSAGHKYNMIAPEQGDVIESVDDAIGELVDFLDESVGPDQYVLVVTADHGQTPLEAGGWPIARDEIRNDINQAFPTETGDSVVQRTSSTVFFMNEEVMKRNGIKPAKVAAFMSRYTIGENIPDGEQAPEGFEDRLDERIFEAVFPGSLLDDVVSCTGALEQ